MTNLYCLFPAKKCARHIRWQDKSGISGLCSVSIIYYWHLKWFSCCSKPGAALRLWALSWPMIATMSQANAAS